MRTKTKVTLVSLFLSLILLAAPVLAGAEQLPFFSIISLKRLLSDKSFYLVMA